MTAPRTSKYPSSIAQPFTEIVVHRMPRRLIPELANRSYVSVSSSKVNIPMGSYFNNMMLSGSRALWLSPSPRIDKLDSVVKRSRPTHVTIGLRPKTGRNDASYWNDAKPWECPPVHRKSPYTKCQFSGSEVLARESQ